MQFNDSDATKFWPIFQQYDAELTTIGDGRMKLIVDYARNYENLTNEQADALMSKAFELEAQRAILKKKFFDKMKAQLSATQPPSSSLSKIRSNTSLTFRFPPVCQGCKRHRPDARREGDKRCEIQESNIAECSQLRFWHVPR